MIQILKNKTVYFLFWLFILIPLKSEAQSINIHHPQLKFLFEDSLLQSQSFHSVFSPYEINWKQYSDIFGGISTESKPRTFIVSPVIDAVLGYQQDNKDFFYKFGQGAYISGDIGKKIGFELSFALYEQKFPGETKSLDSLKLVPRFNRSLWNKNENAAYLGIYGNIYWKANKWLTFKAGYDKNFIGDGQQSLFLSENAAAYPFFQTRLKMWKLQYQHQVMIMRDLVYERGDKRFTKYSSQHTISYNATPRLNVYIFEAVIWRKQDSIRTRSFDLTYLNPFIFFRPVEFNQGSPDNVLMGVGGKLRLFNKSYVYSQLLLDEFHFKEVKANRGWWGLKYGYQLGFKTYGLFKNRQSMLLIEYNQVRPFTYSHSYSLQNYGYLKQPLAHSLGSNFKEITGVFHIAVTNIWFVHAKGSYMKYGTDPEGLNYGSDIYKGQWSFSKKFDNYISQGDLHTVLSGELTVSRLLIPSWRLTAFSTFALNLHKTNSFRDWQPMVQIGLNTLLYE